MNVMGVLTDAAGDRCRVADVSPAAHGFRMECDQAIGQGPYRLEMGGSVVSFSSDITWDGLTAFAFADSGARLLA